MFLWQMKSTALSLASSDSLDIINSKFQQEQLRHLREMHGKPVSAGVYLYQIQAGGFMETRKMVLLKYN
jgi:hypothetical protein